MTYTQTFIGISAFIVAVGIFIAFQTTDVGAVSLPGESAKVATSTPGQTVVAGSVELLFATSTGCVSRTIGTRGFDLMLTFSDVSGSRPSQTTGFVHTASTTVTYDSATVGCGALYAYPYGSGTVGLQEAF